MLTLPCVLIFATAAFAFTDDHCCCGCPYSCPVKIPQRCGAAPTTPCEQKEYFNNSELLSPCVLIIKLHDLTVGMVREMPKEHSGQPVPIGKDGKKPNSVTVTDSQSSASKNLSSPRFEKGEVVRNETKAENGIWKTVRTIPGETEITRVSIRNDTNITEVRARWHRVMSDMKKGIGKIDDGFTNMQHGVIDSFDSLFKGLVDGVFGFLRAAR